MYAMQWNKNAWIRRRFIGNQIDIIREERTA